MTNGPAHDTTADARHGSHPGGTGGPTSPVDSGPESYRQLQLANRTLGTRNAKLTELLKASRDKLDELNGRLDALAEPPSTYGTLLETGPDAFTAEVHTAGRRMRLMVSPRVDRIDLTPGALVRLGEGSQVVEVCGTTDAGDLASVVEVVDAFVWVVDPQKYADAALHEQYLRRFAGHAAVTIVVLNQVDLVPEGERRAVRDHLARLLDEDGLHGVRVVVTSTVTGEGVDAVTGTWVEPGATVPAGGVLVLREETDTEPEG